MADEDPRRLLALSYAPPTSRAAFGALLDLDAKLGAILRGTSEPLVGQMRLTWWHEALTRLDAAAPLAEPTLQALAAHVLPRGVSGRELAGLIEGWEALLDDDLGEGDALDGFGARRGALLFDAMARVAGASATDPVAAAGRGWALADLAEHVRDPELAARARSMAEPALAGATAARWSRPGRILGALALMAAHDLAGEKGRGSSARHVLRLLWHRLTGR